MGLFLAYPNTTKRMRELTGVRTIMCNADKEHMNRTKIKMMRICPCQGERGQTMGMIHCQESVAKNGFSQVNTSSYGSIPPRISKSNIPQVAGDRREV